MKGSINRGGVKDATASPLRALSGSPRCPLVGEQDITYNGIISYSNGVVGIQIPPQTAPSGLPFAKWILDTTIIVNSPVASTGFQGASSAFSFSVMQAIAGFTHITDFGPVVPFDQALIELSAWSQATLSFAHTDETRKANATDQWLVGPPQNVSSAQLQSVGGPDLLSVLDIDLGSAGKYFSRVTLPEQLDFCSYSFYPFLRRSDFFGKVWISSAADGFLGGNPIQGWSLGGFQTGLYPKGTQIGTVQFRFRRLDITALFSFTPSPPRTMNFHNQSLYNGALAPTWDWDFGDGSAHSTDANPPPHTYGALGLYHVFLRATDPLGVVHTFDQYVNLQLVSKFSFTTQPAVNGIFYIFTNLSIGAVTWDWDWGDGSPHDHTQSPVFHKYSLGGSFTITLTITDGNGNTVASSQVIST